jgi:hypothetical protein
LTLRGIKAMMGSHSIINRKGFFMTHFGLEATAVPQRLKPERMRQETARLKPRPFKTGCEADLR